MFVHSRIWLFAILVLYVCALCPESRAEDDAARAEDDVDQAITDISDYWSSPLTADMTEEPVELPSVSLEEITPVQMLTPQRRPGLRTAQRSQRTAAASSDSGLSSVPFMIGDTGAGSCVSFNGLIDVELAHPTLACSRLNISENNSPLPTDRVFFSYRHFHNAIPTRVYQFPEDFNLDRFTLGGERTFFDEMMSVEIRVPIEGRLTSDLLTQVRTDIPVFNPLNGDRRAELGNVSAVFKALLCERRDFAISAGCGVTLPTAQDVDYSVDLLTEIFFVDFPGVSADTDVLFEINVANESVYLSPFLAWLWQPSQRCFHQGFMQVEIAANPSGIIAAGDGLNDFRFNGALTGDTLDWRVNFPAGRTELIAQTLLRLNLGWGYILSQNPRADWVQRLSALFEVHYTSTLNDANFGSIPVQIQSTVGVPPMTTIDFGNRNNRVDIVNLVAGLSANMGKSVITHGVTVPITEGANRGFDFEYNMQVQRPF
ncbi:MAG: hypothetical protein MI725_04310 [Pirellulales bacterium]|nr:hypothetical protein [Pirellulales bacterium]